MISRDLLARLCHARERLQSELEPPVKVATLAAQAGLSTPHFITQFSALFGETPLQCRTRMRLELARERLAQDGESITQIGLGLGFENLGSFSRLFRHRFGKTPRAYRREAKGPVLPPAGCVALMNLARGAGEISAKSANAGDANMRSVTEP